MSFFQNPSFYIQTAEADIVNFFDKVKGDIEVLEADFLNVLSWVSANAGEIGGLLTGLLGTAAAVAGGNIPTAITSGLSLLQQGITVVNQAAAAAASEKAKGGSVSAQTTAALAQGYALIKQAQAQGAAAAATAAAPSLSP